ncbi:MAG: sigma-70 family RNA polymerase sigma factor [Verrucomicrobia bacterium]|nr:sigma-70 family RNA polymerase sigma factor [Verrucomicrobiota bacterium]
MSPPDSELITRAVRQDDRAAFGELVLRHQDAVRRFLRHLTRGDAALADDLAQDTFVQAHRSLSRFRSDSPFSTWLLGIAHNHFRNARRRQRETELTAADEPTEPATAPRSVALQADLSAAIARLDADEQTALFLFYQEDLSHPEIAAVTGWPLGTVKTHLARAKDNLRPLLADWNPRP